MLGVANTDWLSMPTDWLNTNSGVITAIATVTLAVATFWYARHVRGQLKQLRRQADLLQDRDRLEVKRALRGIIREVEVNANIVQKVADGHPENRKLFLCSTYLSSHWALVGVPMSDFTADTISMAFLWANRFNVHFTQYGVGTDTNLAEKQGIAWSGAKREFPLAMRHIKQDKALQTFLADA